MKKFLSLIATFAISLLLFGCVIEEDNEKEHTLFLPLMDSTIYVKYYSDNDKLIDEISDIFDLYSQISSSHNRNEVLYNNPYYNYENIYTINENAGIKPVEVVDELIELVEYGIMLGEQTNGYFNIGIGKLIDFWKEIISSKLEPEEDDYYTEDKYDNALQQAENIEEADLSKIVIDKENKTIYLKDDSIKLDLGALSKGYALNKAVELIKENNIKKYVINAGLSSIAFGLSESGKEYKIGINEYENRYENGYVGIIKTRDTALSTSGSNERFISVYDKNKKKIPEKLIHHIVSPFTKKPENYYLTVCLVGPDAGLMDAYSTTVFLMDPDMAVSFLEANNISYLLYLTDYRVITNFSEEMFTFLPLK